MKRIGMIVAVEIEAVNEALDTPLWEKEVYGFNLSCYQVGEVELLVAETGAGILPASEATELLILKYGVDTILNFGVVGALTEEIAYTPCVFVKDVVHYEADLNFIDGLPIGQHAGFDSPFIPLDEGLLELARKSSPDTPLVRCASGDKFIGPDKKEGLHKDFDADICDMELAGIVYTATRFGAKVFSCKMVSDSVKGGKA